MKNKLTILFLFFIVLTKAQQTKKYLYFSNQIEPLKTERKIEKYKNRNTKKIYNLTTFIFNSEEYLFYSGKYIEYKKNGKIRLERVMDLFGCLLSATEYLYFGNVITYKTIELDTTAENLENFLFGKKSAIVTLEEKEFYTNEKKELILFKKGIRVNGEKSGIWETYNKDEVIKSKEYKIRNKYKNIEKSKIIRFNNPNF